MRATDPVRCQERRESAEKRKEARGDEVPVAEEEGVAHKAPAREEGGARPREDPSQRGTRMPDGKGAAGRLFMRRQTIGSSSPRAPLLVDDALCRGRDEERGGNPQERARGDTQLVEEGIHQLLPGRPQLRRPVRPQRRQGLQEHCLLQDDDLAQARPSGLHGTEEAGMRYPLETAKSPILEVAPMGELCQLLKGFLEALDPLVLVEGLVRSTIDLVEEVRRRKEEHKH